MPSLIPDYSYDIFISYRHKDNRTGWVTEFVQHLKEELEATFKEDVSIYFDSNVTDGLLENHNVDKSLEGKIKSLIFIPILSQTYCDVRSFAWQHEFVAFNYLSSRDQFGRDIKLRTGNVASRILPIRIHDLDPEDQKLLEDELRSVIRPIDFIYKEPGVGRPLLPADNEDRNLNKTKYLNQINKVAHAVKDVITAMKQPRPLERESPATPVSLGRKSGLFSKKVLLTLALLLVLVSATIGVTTLLDDKAAVEETIDRSIAVLPFVDMSPAKDQEYFSDGLSEELLNLLAKVPDLKVISRTSAFSFKGKNEDIRSIADKLDVAYLLEGSVRKSDDKIRITAQLIKASDGSHLWSENYDREMNDIFKVQDEIADAVVSQLKIKLLGNTSLKPRESKPEVYNLYLEGKFYANLGTEAGKQKALEIFKKATALDSTDARVMAQLSSSYSTLSGSSIALNSREMKDFALKSKQTAEKAIALDPNLAEGYVALGYILSSEWDFENAEKATRKALEMDPTNYYFLNAMAVLNVVFGKFEEAEVMYKKSIELDPIRASSFFSLGNLCQAEGRFEESLALYHKAVALTPRPSFFTQIANLHLLMGNPEQAMIENQKIEDGFWKEYNAILTLWSLGRKAECDARLKKYETDNAEVASYQVAEMYAWRKDADKTFEWLDRAYDTRDPGLAEIKSSVFFKPYRNDPRYIAMLRKLKLPI